MKYINIYTYICIPIYSYRYTNEKENDDDYMVLDFRCTD